MYKSSSINSKILLCFPSLELISDFKGLSPFRPGEYQIAIANDPEWCPKVWVFEVEIASSLLVFRMS